MVSLHFLPSESKCSVYVCVSFTSFICRTTDVTFEIFISYKKLKLFYINSGDIPCNEFLYRKRMRKAKNCIFQNAVLKIF